MLVSALVGRTTTQVLVGALQTPIPNPRVLKKNFPNPKDPQGLKEVLRNVRKARSSLPLWDVLTRKAKDDVKAWFVERGNKKGVPFGALIEYFRTHQETVQENYQHLWNTDLYYPDYYTQTFHGYETGNLSFEAAEDCLPATLSMSITYWPHTSPVVTADWMRHNYTDALLDYCLNDAGMAVPPKTIVDLAGSVGVSTQSLLQSFPKANVALVDLSPHFLATAKMFLETSDSYIYEPTAQKRVTYHHELAEDTPFEDDSRDVVSMSFLIHELPSKVTVQVLCEALRILKPGGVVSILDLESSVLQRLPPIRRFLFGVTEPHIYDYCQNTNLVKMMEEVGFVGIKQDPNDPMNTRTMGTKPKRA